ncbi:MAG: bifunctional oligoribonuclease/PAP phosphatase NrnA, partial [Actinobacteria bacterium]
MNEHPDNSHQLDEDLATAAALISAAGQVALACHVAPDGDALGSMLALHHVLRAGGRDSVAAFAGVQVTGPHYRELPGLDLLSDPLRYPAEPEVMVTLDCGSLGRLGDLALNAKAAKELVVVDHHVSNTHFGSIHLVDP